MANTFKNSVTASIGTLATDVYTAPGATTTTVIGAAVSNRAASVIAVDATVTDTSGSVTAYLVKAAPVAIGGALVLIGGDQKVVLETGDKITVTSDTAASADVVISVLEQT
jgi:hypothetical protein